jgi:hypothetical protein
MRDVVCSLEELAETEITAAVIFASLTVAAADTVPASRAGASHAPAGKVLGR